MASKRLLVTGGRDFTLADEVHRALHPIHTRFGISVLAHGGARGLDTLAKLWALSFGIEPKDYDIAQVEWDVWGNRAGNMRNSRMLRDFKPDMGVAFPGGSGTADMTSKLLDAGIPTMVGRWTSVERNRVRWELKNGS
jgi:hypothetical protein